MALNQRKSEHIKRVRIATKLGEILNNLVAEVVQANAEEFSSGQNEITDNDLSEGAYNFTLSAFNSAVNQFCDHYNKFWNGTDSISQREHGNDARKVILHDAGIRLPNGI